MLHVLCKCFRLGQSESLSCCYRCMYYAISRRRYELQPAALVFVLSPGSEASFCGVCECCYRECSCVLSRRTASPYCRRLDGRASMSSQCYTVAMDLSVCQLRNFSISFLSSVLGKESAAVRLDNSSSGASVVAIDNKIEQAMDLVKSHLMYAVREEVEVLKEQIKELIERNTQLEQENKLLKTLASPEQMAQFQAQVQTGSPTSNTQPPLPAGPTPVLPSTQNSGTSA